MDSPLARVILTVLGGYFIINFLAEEFFAKFSVDVLLLEPTPKELKRLIKRMNAGRTYFPLLDADIMNIRIV